MFSEAEYGVAASERVVNRGRIPAGGGYEMVGSPYVVAGELYVPRDDPNYSEVGTASWYGANFHGRLTANGEVYDMNRLSAAHTTLPLPSYVRVTNLENGASVVVRVNDRGPFHGDRIIDLSARAAEMLDMTAAGTAQVRVDYVGRASLEGDDTRMLMATYQAPGANNSRVAYDASTRTISTRRGLFSLFQDETAATVFEPSAIPAGNDPLANLLGNAQGYAPADERTSAQLAAEVMAEGGTIEDPQTPVVIQVGVFSVEENAAAISVALTEYGTVTMTELETNSGPLWSIRVLTDAAMRQTTIDAAEAAGADGAYAIN